MIPSQKEPDSSSTSSEGNPAPETEKRDVPSSDDTSPSTPVDKTGESGEEQYITGTKLYLVLLGVTLVAFLVMLDQTILVTAIPRISDEFNSLTDIGWYGGAYLLTLASLQPISGKIYQYYSSKTIFLGGLMIFEAGSLICALAKSSTMLIIGRAIAGVGGSGLLTGLLTILANSTPLQKRPKYLGGILGLASLGLVLGPLLGGVFTQHVTWRWCFYINLPFGGITFAILLAIKIPDSKIITDTKPTMMESIMRLDLPGCVIFLPACLMLLLTLQWGGNEHAWNSATIIGLFCGSAATTVVFLFWERTRGDGAMVPLSMLRNMVLACGAITALLSAATQFVITYYLPIWFQVVKGVGPVLGGVYFFPTVGGMVIANLVAGILTTKLGFYTPWSIAGAALCAIFSGLFSTMTPSSGPGIWVTYQIFSGIGRGMMMQQPLTAMQVVLPKASIPVGTSLIMFSQTLAGALFVPLAQATFSNALRPALIKYAPNVNVDAVMAVGATDYASVVTGAENIRGVVKAYNEALTVIFYLGVGASSVAVFTSWGLGFKNLKTKKQEETKAGEEKV